MSGSDFIVKTRKESSELRKGEFEFQGFEREFIFFQEQLINDYEKSSGLKHPVNRGDAREDYLKIFLSEQGLIPHKFGISKVSSRVVSGSGHHSEELDIVFYDKANNTSLLKYQSTEFYPVEWVHGVIQVKSCIRNKKTIKDGLRNIASFKKLKKSGTSILNINGMQVESPVNRGFGILFAYKATLKWATMISAIKGFMAENTSEVWPNAIVILDQGVIIPMGEDRGAFQTAEIDKLDEPNVMSRPDQGDCLLNLYSILTDLLNGSRLGGFNYSDYLRLPLTSGDISYSFSMEGFAEIGNCEKHGKFLRTVSQDALKKIITCCEGIEPISWIKATDIAYGQEDDNKEAYKRQQGIVYIYNPEDLPLKDVLTYDKGGLQVLAYDSLNIAGKTYWVPYVYSIKDNLVAIECPKCKKA